MTMMSLLCRRLWTSFLLLVVGTSSYHLASSFVLDSPAGVQSHRALTEFKAHNTDNNESSSFFLSSSEVSTRMMTAKSFFAGILTAGMLMFSAPNLPAAHAESRLIGEVKGSGLVFKDTLTIESFDDPKVKGVTLYVSNFQRPLTERLSKDFFSDPSSASVGCAKTGSIQIADNIGTGPSGEEVFEESRSLLFKTLRVQRIYDKEKNTMVYVSFNTRLDKNEDSNKSRFKSSICAVNLD